MVNNRKPRNLPLNSGSGGGGGPAGFSPTPFPVSSSISSEVSSLLTDLSLIMISLRFSPPLMLRRYSEGLINLLGSATGKLGGTKGKTRWRLPGDGVMVVVVEEKRSSSLRLTIVRSEQEELRRRAAESTKNVYSYKLYLWSFQVFFLQNLTWTIFKSK